MNEQDLNTRIEKAINEIIEIIKQDGFIFNGVICDILEKFYITEQKHIKYILDEIGVRNNKTRGYIYERMRGE